MSEKSPHYLLIIQISLISLLMVSLVLFFIFREPFIILLIIAIILAIITLFIGKIIYQRRGNHWKLPHGLVKYYLLMVGILVAQIGIGYLFFIIASSFPTIFAVLSVLIFLSLIVFLIVSRYKETIKIHPKEKVLARYKKLTIKSGIIVLVVLAGIIFIKALILLIRVI